MQVRAILLICAWEKKAMKAVEDFAFGFLFPQKEKKEIHCQKVPNKCLNGLDIIFTGDKKSLNIRSTTRL